MQRNGMYSITLMLFFFFFLPGLAGATVWTVGPSGDFTEIQAAVTASSDGDTILVGSGSYAAVTIDNKSLVVTADSNADATVFDGITVQNLTAERTVVLRGLKTDFNYPIYTEGLFLKDNRGAVRIEDCFIDGADGLYDIYGIPQLYDAANGVAVEGCDDVAFARCTLVGGAADAGDAFFVGDGMHGLSANDSMVTLYDCELEGGRGGHPTSSSTKGGSGGCGYFSANARLFASGSTFTGGQGGKGGDGDAFGGGGDGGDGGHGIHLTGGASVIHLLDNGLMEGQGGSGGNAGPWYPAGDKGEPGEPLKVDGGVVDDLPGTAHTFVMASPLRENDTVDLTFTGEPGDLAALFLGTGPDGFYVPDLRGQWLLSFAPPPALFIFGTIPPSGELSFSTVIPSMGPGFTAVTFYTQSLFGNSLGDPILGSPVVLTILD